MNRRWSFLLGILIVLVFLINYQVNKSINSFVESPLKKNKVFLKKEVSKKKEIVQKKVKIKKWKESDPKDFEKYGITVIPAKAELSTQEEWHTYVEDNLKKAQLLESNAGKEAVKMIQVNQEEYGRVMKKVDEDVVAVQDRLKKDPFNSKNKEQIQNIYKLKAIGEALKDKIVFPDNGDLKQILPSRESQ